MMRGLDAVKCPTCAGIQDVEVGAVQYTCTLCGSEWTWAACLGCGRLEPALAGQESWRCSRCGRYTRSWWRSTTASDDALRIAGLRLEARRGTVRARAVAPRRRRRHAATIAGAVAGTVGAAFALVAVIGGPSTADQDRAACSAFAETRSQTINGGLAAAGSGRTLEAAGADAAERSTPIASAMRDLAGAGRPGTSTFLVAQTKVVQACQRGTP